MLDNINLYNTRRKYSLNEFFFDEINSEEKAYFLGLLYADGTNSTKKTEISLRLHGEEDSHILYDLSDLLQTNKPITTYKQKGRKLGYRLIINSKHISYKLNDLGVIPNKTFKIKFPKWLKDELYPHFIRGYFDGDGYVGYNEAAKGYQFSLVGTEEFLLKVQEILIKKCGHNKVKLLTRFPERKNNIRALNYTGNINSKKFYNYIYSNATIFLKRKKNKFDNILNT